MIFSMPQPAENQVILSGSPETATEGSYLRRLLRNDGWAVLVIAAATIFVELGAYWLSISMGTSAGRALVATMAVAVLWLAIAGPAAAAWGKGAWSSLMRCGAVADASGIVLIILWIVATDENGRARLNFLTVVEMYCVLASMAILAMALVCMFHSPAGKAAMALIASACMFIAMASPFWAGWWLTGDDPRANQNAATWLVAVNPFFAILTCLNDIRASAFDWLTSDVMYQITRMSDYVAPRRVPWYETTLLWLAAAAGACIVGFVARLLHPKSRSAIVQQESPSK